ncbi:hypothetical protein [Novipirellula artificiosorum]|uniref:Uncharacterized protein n=1 Tax=Novipirellula artificiosorum TaxID=2528016 RepID=A0A5C6D7W3_9BACT|nr:hypothetical protein [Novipirellula artificiosorum]TWU32910.1 hypothetical protein Poly41_52880 [Novipirellula artificiosorum]
MSNAPFTILLALLPLIGYLILLGVIRVIGRPLVTTGARDIAALGIAISGLVAVGPAELFFPAAAASAFGPYVWVSLALFYFLCVLLVALTSKPRLVAYGRSAQEIYEPLLKAAQTLDAAATGDPGRLQISMPTANVRLRIDGQPGADYAQIFAFEPNLTPHFWSQLQAHLREQVATSPRPRNLHGYAMLITAACLVAFLAWQSLGREELVVEGFRNWLWR